MEKYRLLETLESFLKGNSDAESFIHTDDPRINTIIRRTGTLYVNALFVLKNPQLFIRQDEEGYIDIKKNITAIECWKYFQSVISKFDKERPCLKLMYLIFQHRNERDYHLNYDHWRDTRNFNSDKTYGVINDDDFIGLQEDGSFNYIAGIYECRQMEGLLKYFQRKLGGLVELGLHSKVIFDFKIKKLDKSRLNSVAYYNGKSLEYYGLKETLGTSDIRYCSSTICYYINELWDKSDYHSEIIEDDEFILLQLWLLTIRKISSGDGNKEIFLHNISKKVIVAISYLITDIKKFVELETEAAKVAKRNSIISDIGLNIIDFKGKDTERVLATNMEFIILMSMIENQYNMPLDVNASRNVFNRVVEDSSNYVNLFQINFNTNYVYFSDRKDEVMKCYHFFNGKVNVNAVYDEFRDLMKDFQENHVKYLAASDMLDYIKDSNIGEKINKNLNIPDVGIYLNPFIIHMRGKYDLNILDAIKGYAFDHVHLNAYDDYRFEDGIVKTIVDIMNENRRIPNVDILVNFIMDKYMESIPENRYYIEKTREFLESYFKDINLKYIDDAFFETNVRLYYYRVWWTLDFCLNSYNAEYWTNRDNFSHFGSSWGFVDQGYNFNGIVDFGKDFTVKNYGAIAYEKNPLNTLDVKAPPKVTGNLYPWIFDVNDQKIAQLFSTLPTHLRSKDTKSDVAITYTLMGNVGADFVGAQTLGMKGDISNTKNLLTFTKYVITPTLGFSEYFPDQASLEKIQTILKNTSYSESNIIEVIKLHLIIRCYVMGTSNWLKHFISHLDEGMKLTNHLKFVNVYLLYKFRELTKDSINPVVFVFRPTNKIISKRILTNRLQPTDYYRTNNSRIILGDLYELIDATDGDIKSTIKFTDMNFFKEYIDVFQISIGQLIDEIGSHENENMIGSISKNIENMHGMFFRTKKKDMTEPQYSIPFMDSLELKYKGEKTFYSLLNWYTRRERYTDIKLLTIPHEGDTIISIYPIDFDVLDIVENADLDAMNRNINGNQNFDLPMMREINYYIGDSGKGQRIIAIRTPRNFDYVSLWNHLILKKNHVMEMNVEGFLDKIFEYFKGEIWYYVEYKSYIFDFLDQFSNMNFEKYFGGNLFRYDNSMRKYANSREYVKDMIRNMKMIKEYPIESARYKVHRFLFIKKYPCYIVERSFLNRLENFIIIVDNDKDDLENFKLKVIDEYQSNIDDYSEPLDVLFDDLSKNEPFIKILNKEMMESEGISNEINYGGDVYTYDNDINTYTGERELLLKEYGKRMKVVFDYLDQKEYRSSEEVDDVLGSNGGGDLEDMFGDGAKDHENELKRLNKQIEFIKATYHGEKRQKYIRSIKKEIEDENYECEKGNIVLHSMAEHGALYMSDMNLYKSLFELMIGDVTPNRKPKKSKSKIEREKKLRRNSEKALGEKFLFGSELIVDQIDKNHYALGYRNNVEEYKSLITAIYFFTAERTGSEKAELMPILDDVTINTFAMEYKITMTDINLKDQSTLYKGIARDLNVTLNIIPLRIKTKDEIEISDVIKVGNGSQEVTLIQISKAMLKTYIVHYEPLF